MLKTIAVLLGSHRKGSLNQRLFKAVSHLTQGEADLTAIDGMRDLPLYSQEIEERGMPDLVTSMAHQLRSANAIMIISPEYNYSIPGPLKNQIDWLSRVENQPLDGKPVSLMSASPSPMGGIRAQYHLRDVLVALGGRVTNRPEVAIAHAQDRLSDDGRITHDATQEVVKNHLQKLYQLMGD